MRGYKRGRLIVFLAFAFIMLFLNSGGIKTAAAVMVERAETIRIRKLTQGYSVLETENFSIRFAEKDAAVVQRVAHQAEKQFNLAAEYFGYKLEKKTVLTVYHDKERLQQGLRLPYRGTTLGAYYAGTISILSPSIWGIEGDAAEEGLYIHELIHLIMADMAGGNYPLWFTEGMALYLEYINTGFEWGEEYVFDSPPYSLAELTGEFVNLDQFIAYKQSFMIVKELMEREGRDKVLELFESLRSNISFDLAFTRVYGYSPVEFERSFVEYGKK
jgi:hypothetical protein